MTGKQYWITLLILTGTSLGKNREREKERERKREREKERDMIKYIYIIFVVVYSQQNTDFVCNAQTTCRKCIQASPLCSWCADPVS